MKLKTLLLSLFLVSFSSISAQDAREKYEAFKKNVEKEYFSFREECNKKYADFLRTTWNSYNKEEPIPKPKEENPIPPLPYEEEKHQDQATVIPEVVKPTPPSPQPKPIEPIKENPVIEDKTYQVNFYGISPKVRFPDEVKFILKDVSPNTIADAWEKFSGNHLDNTIRDCLENRIRYNLSDWAYLQFLNNFAADIMGDENTATLLAAYLFCQSGYQMRLGIDAGKLIMLFGSEHRIYEMPYFVTDGTRFYPYQKVNGRIQICDVPFKGETPLSLLINEEQKLGPELSKSRIITSAKYPAMSVESKAPLALIEFYNTYPTSALDDNILTRWAMYANTPIAGTTKEFVYPALKKTIEGKSELEAVNQLLNWVQTGFVYEFDDVVWGGDRAFFAEETLFYPYADCEDRSILFSHLIRDLLGLDVALIYYPNHLATAVKFNDKPEGSFVMIEGDPYTICDPTFIGAPVGAQMPNLEYDKMQAIVLERD